VASNNSMVGYFDLSGEDEYTDRSRELENDVMLLDAKEGLFLDRRKLSRPVHMETVTFSTLIAIRRCSQTKLVHRFLSLYSDEGGRTAADNL